MISFFRKIRQKLLAQNKVTRYVAYAIGEIILVVMGILIALQVNNWNEERKNHTAEQRILIALLQEFESNLEILNQTIVLNETIISGCVSLGEFTGPSLGKIDELELSDLMIRVFKFDARFAPNQGTMDEIVNTGRLSVLSDPELRKAITSWQSELELLKNQENYVAETRDIAHDFFMKKGNFRRHLDIIDENLSEVTHSKFPENDFKFLENQEFESQLYLLYVTSKNLNLNYYFPLKIKIQAILEQLKEDIN